MELRQLRYFVAVAEELHFGRAAQRVHISGPALSQQIIAMEREFGTDLFVRDRRSVRLSEAGRSLLADARRILALADDAKRRVQQAGAQSAPVRLGYVSWLPDDLTNLVGTAVSLRIDEWVLPSHVQVDRVAEGTLDIALTWVTAEHAKERGLVARLLRAEPLHAVLPGATSTEPVVAQRLTVLADALRLRAADHTQILQLFKRLGIVVFEKGDLFLQGSHLRIAVGFVLRKTCGLVVTVLQVALYLAVSIVETIVLILQRLEFLAAHAGEQHYRNQGGECQRLDMHIKVFVLPHKIQPRY